MRIIKYQVLTPPPLLSDTVARAILLSDILLWVSGVCVGLIVAIILIPRLLQKVYISPRLEDNKDVDMVFIIDKKTGRECYFINPRSRLQSISLFISYLWWRMLPNSKKKTSYRLHNSFATKLILSGLTLVLILLVVNAIFSIVSIIVYTT